MDERLKQQLAFLLEIDKEKRIKRQTHISGYSRRETDAEHAWHMALMAITLQEYANEPVDLLKTIKMILAHDLVEIYAGDTYAYDEAGKLSQKQREEEAADRLFGMLPDDQSAAFRALWDEFEAAQTPEAKFARTMDNLQPLTLNDANGGRDWLRHDIKKSQVMARNACSHEGSEVLGEYIRRVIQKNTDKGILRDE